VTWGTPVQSFVFLGLLVFELEPMYATSDGQTDRRTTDADDCLMPPPPLRGRGHNKFKSRLSTSVGFVVVSDMQVATLRLRSAIGRHHVPQKAVLTSEPNLLLRGA